MLTTEQIIKILPFDESFKHLLIERLASLTQDQKYVMEKAVWGLYDALYALHLDEKIALAMQDNGGQKLDKEFYKRIRSEVEEEMRTMSAEQITKVDLSETRKQLEELTKGAD